MSKRPHETARAAARSRAGLFLVATACVVTGGIALFASGREWVRFTVAQPPLAHVHGAASGHVVAGAAAPLALVVVAGVVAFPATRKLGRRLVAALVGLAGVGLIVTTVQVAVEPREAVASEAARLTGQTGVLPESAALTVWPWIALAMGALAVGIGMSSAVHARQWAAMGRRYDADAPPKPGAVDETSMWDRLDRGDDPTL